MNPHPPTTHVFVVNEHLDNAGRRVVHRKTVIGAPDVGFRPFVGIGQISVQIPGLPPQISAYKFDLEGVETLDEAFAKFDHFSEVAGRLHAEELQRSLMRAAEQPPPGIAVASPEEAQRVLAAGRDKLSRKLA